MPPETIQMSLVGDRPLLMHAARLSDPLDPIALDLKRLAAKRGKVAADYEELARIEWYGGLWLADGAPCIPGEALESCFAAAARTRRMGRAAGAGFMVARPAPLDYGGPRDIDALWRMAEYRFRFPVQVNGSRTMRTRPRFMNWSAIVEAEFLPSLLTRADILEIFRIAGAQVGIGDWRPKFGRFRVNVDAA